MTRIAISANRLVDYSQDRWRLIEVDEPTKPALIVEAKKGAPLRYNDDFAHKHDLPPTGEILSADLKQVVLGWSSETQSWQLGLALSPEASLARASRWFELLRISDSDAAQYEATAAQLGRALAKILDIPFVAPARDAEPNPEAAPPLTKLSLSGRQQWEAATYAPLAELPLTLGLWRLQSAPDSAELQLLPLPGWRRRQQWRLAKYALLAAVYLAVSLATLASDLGLPGAGTLIGSFTNAVGLSNLVGLPPNDLLLPYLGIAVGVLLVLALLWQIWQSLRAVNRFVIDPSARSISAWRGRRQCWKIAASAVQSVYVSEVLKFSGRRRGPWARGERLTVQHAEINLHLLDDSFLPLFIERDKLSAPLLPGQEAAAAKDRPSELSPLNPDEAITSLQAAAAHIARGLGDLPLWYDMRK